MDEYNKKLTDITAEAIRYRRRAIDAEKELADTEALLTISRASYLRIFDEKVARCERIAALEDALCHCSANISAHAHDTVWYDTAQTLCDYIDEVVAGDVQLTFEESK